MAQLIKMVAECKSECMVQSMAFGLVLPLCDHSVEGWPGDCTLGATPGSALASTCIPG